MQYIEEAYRRGATNVYTDTDSLKFDHEILLDMVNDGYIPVGNRYGEFKLEEVCHSFILLGSKCFYGSVDSSMDNPFKQEWKNGKKDLMKAKGVPGKLLVLQDYLDAVDNLRYNKKEVDLRGSKQFVSVRSVKSIFKERGLVMPIERKRKLTDIRNSFAWQYVDGRIYPRGYDLNRRPELREELAEWKTISS
jgi:hypothetical protein